MREVESTFPAWLMSEAAIGWTQTSLGITALSLIPARGPKTLAWRSLTWAKAMTEFIVVVSISRLHKPELQGSTWLLWVSTVFLVAFEKDSFGMCLGASDLFSKTENRLWHKNATIFCPRFDALAFPQKNIQNWGGQGKRLYFELRSFSRPWHQSSPLGTLFNWTHFSRHLLGQWRGIYHGGKYLFSQLFHMCVLISPVEKAFLALPLLFFLEAFHPEAKGVKKPHSNPLWFPLYSRFW